MSKPQERDFTLKAPVTNEEWKEHERLFKGKPLEPWPEDPNYFQELWAELEGIQQ
jgi:hypothetical protein